MICEFIKLLFLPIFKSQQKTIILGFTKYNIYTCTIIFDENIE